MTTISSATSTTGATSGGTIGTSSSQFSDNTFLNLLVTEMRTQTPLKPVDNDSFMQQMASYSSMTEQKELNSNLLKLLDFQGALARLQGLSQSSSLLGKNVTFVDADDPTKTDTGVVSSVFVNDKGEVKLKVGDKEVGMNQIVGVTQDEGGSGGNTNGNTSGQVKS